MRSLRYWEAISEATVQCMEADPSIFLTGIGVDDFKGIFGTTAEAYRRFGAARAQDDEWFGIDVAARDEKLVVTIHDRHGGFTTEAASDAEIGQVRERLAALYGERAQLTLKQIEGGTAAVMEIPYESIADSVPA